MKADYIKLTTKGVEATGRYVPHAIGSFLVLHVGRGALILIPLLVWGPSAWPLILRVAARFGL